MIYIYTIPLVIIVICLAIILVIVIKKFPQLAMIDTSTIAKEREAEIKQKIISERLKRKFLNGWKIFLNLVRPIGQFLKLGFRKIYNKVLELERYYQERGAKIMESGGLERKIKLLFNEAEELSKKENFTLAEKKYIEIISLDKKNMKAYEELGNLYLKAKQYPEAEEIFSFILKRNPSDASVHVSLGELFLAKDKPGEALNYFEKAVALRPNNPKYLDFLIETSIMVGNKDLAHKAFNRLAQVNPENQKLGEFKKRIEEIVEKEK